MSLLNPASWAPPGESPTQLWEERSNFAGIVLSSVAYGVHLTLYLLVVQHLILHPTRKSAVAGSGSKHHVSWTLVAYISWNFLLGTFGIAAEARFNQLTFIDDRNFPGGPDAFIATMYSDFVNMFGTAAYVVLNWFADGLVIYRFWLIYNFNYWIAALPCLLLLGSIAMGCMLLFQLTQPNANLWSQTTVNFGIPYWSISASLNILVTSLIVAKLYLIRRRTRAVLSTHHSRTYISVATMLIESAFLYSATALIFIITYARNSQIQNLVLPVLGQVQAISPLLIMWRVARGQAISKERRADASDWTTPSKISWRRSFSDMGRRSRSNFSKTQSHLESGGGGYYDEEGVMELDSTFSTGEQSSRTEGSMSMVPLAGAKRVVLAPLKRARFGSMDRSRSGQSQQSQRPGTGTGTGTGGEKRTRTNSNSKTSEEEFEGEGAWEELPTPTTPSSHETMMEKELGVVGKNGHGPGRIEVLVERHTASVWDEGRPIHEPHAL